MAIRTLLAVFALGGLLGLGWYFYPRGHVLDEHVGSDSLWHPNAEEISAQVGPGQAGTFDDVRHIKFSNLFKQRYRDNSQAIGVKFIADDRIKAMFAPIIPRWDMAKVAVKLQKEARGIFGRDYQVDIYETYITAPMRKLAEVKMDSGPLAKVTFDPRFATERLSELIQKRDRKPPVPPLPGIFWPADDAKEIRIPQPAGQSSSPSGLKLIPLGRAGTS